MKITEELIAYVADLAQIELNDAQKSLMFHELGQILGYMDVLNTTDTEGIEPMTHVFPVTNVMRPDVVTGAYDRASLLAGAPECTDEAFVVPRTVG
ncbi:MAG: Asp-tRNA(Asn)/Glu-tRNA(Gln) amidotransferase subunit GatC [Oscillospiraceae bacterium]|nr:Asp-tRNA(Asn)/Glu-tRNA(Gln) amidotransferase subunit GatC [Oscillospiraceae bacterium]